MNEQQTTSPSDSAVAARYWSDQRLVVHVEGPGGARTVRLDKPFARIGRDPRCDVVLDGSVKARVAFYLHATNDGVFAVETAPPAGNRPPFAGWIDPEQDLVLGDFTLRAEPATGGGEPSRDTPAALDVKGSVPSPGPVLRVIASRQSRAIVRLQRRLTIVGRASPCTLRLKSKQVSLPHCALYWHAETLWVVDLVSSNGTLRNGQPIEVTRLDIDSAVQVGDVQLVLTRETHPGPEKEPAGPTEAVSPPAAPRAEEPASISNLQQRLAHERDTWQADRRRKQHKLQLRLKYLDQQLRSSSETSAETAEQGSAPGPLDQKELDLLAEAHAELDQRRKQLGNEQAQLAADRADLGAARAELATEQAAMNRLRASFD